MKTTELPGGTDPLAAENVERLSLAEAARLSAACIESGDVTTIGDSDAMFAWLDSHMAVSC